MSSPGPAAKASRSSIFTIPGGRTAKWIVLAVWLVGIFGAIGANLPGKFTDAEENESTSFLPGDAESTKALKAAEELQGGELAPAVIIFRRESGLTAADRAMINKDVAALSDKRFKGVVADGPTAASGGKGGDQSGSEGGQRPSGSRRRTGLCGTDYRGTGPAGRLPPIRGADLLLGRQGGHRYRVPQGRRRVRQHPRSDPGLARQGLRSPGRLEVKITGGAGYAADAIEVFESINGTLLLAAVTLVIVLLILIYRSPIFLFIPLLAVIFAEMLSRSVGYGLSEIGVTINGQSSSIMSVLVLGAGTDYALLIVSRFREELHHTTDRHEAMAAAMRSAGPAVFASALTVVAALLCLTIAKVNGTAGLGPIGAMGVACAALSMLTLLPALLTIFGRRALWPFVPNTPDTAPTDADARAVTTAPTPVALATVVGASLVALVLLPLTILSALLRRLVALLSGRRVMLPSVISLLDKPVFRPYELRRYRKEKPTDATHGFWARVGARVAKGPRRVAVGSVVLLLVLTAGLAFFSTDLTTNDSYTTDVESTEGQDLVAKSFPSGASVPTDIIVPRGGDVAAVSRAAEGVDGVEAVSPRWPPGHRGR